MCPGGFFLSLRQKPPFSAPHIPYAKPHPPFPPASVNEAALPDGTRLPRRGICRAHLKDQYGRTGGKTFFGIGIFRICPAQAGKQTLFRHPAHRLLRPPVKRLCPRRESLCRGIYDFQNQKRDPLVGETRHSTRQKHRKSVLSFRRSPEDNSGSRPPFLTRYARGRDSMKCRKNRTQCADVYARTKARVMAKEVFAARERKVG